MSRVCIYCDWGSTNLRASVEMEGTVVARLSGPGIARLGDTPPSVALRTTLGDWLSTAERVPIVLCGMAGSRNGLLETPYRAVPADFESWASAAVLSRRDGLDLIVAAGISGRSGDGAAEIMRGEETQIFGALHSAPELAGGRHLLVLPGTHSKWVEIHEGSIMRLQTFITGELFALLSERSSLLRTGGQRGDGESGFAAGCSRATEVGATAALFETRSAQLLDSMSHEWAGEFLSGLLVGDEIENGLRRFEPVSAVTVIGDHRLCDRYARVLRQRTVPAPALDGEACALAGMRLLAQRVKRSP